jgi:hypothetical protein
MALPFYLPTYQAITQSSLIYLAHNSSQLSTCQQSYIILFSFLYRSGLHSCIPLLHTTLCTIFLQSTNSVGIIDASFSSFPHRKLTNIIGKPSNTSLQVIKRRIYDNTTSIPSTCSSGAHGHLGIGLDTVQYMVVSNSIPWVTP